MLLPHFRTLAYYNAWANDKLYDACGQLSEVEYLASRPCFFGSIHSTLNHILVADRIWISHFKHTKNGIISFNQELYADFVGLHVARKAEDALIVNYFEGLDEEELVGWLEYVDMAGEDQVDEISTLLGHFFDRQAHHRGQIHELLSQADAPLQSIDLINFLRERE